MWIDAGVPATASKSWWLLPYQGPRFYHKTAVDFLLQTRRILPKHLGKGLKALALPEGLRKLAINSWLGALQV